MLLFLDNILLLLVYTHNFEILKTTTKMKNKTLLTLALMAFAISVSAQSIVNRLTPTVIESPNASIGTFEDYDFTGVVSHNNHLGIGLLNDFSGGNIIFLGDTDSMSIVLNGGVIPGIFYGPKTRMFETSTSFNFHKTPIIPSPNIKIGAIDGPTGFLIVNGAPASSTDDSYEIGSILSDDNFVYIRTSTGKWKRLFLMDVDISW
jgi:hypothetical protein